MLAHYLIDPDTRHGMDMLAENYLGYTPIPITELIGPKGKKQGNMQDVDIAAVTEYAAEDADITLQLKSRSEEHTSELQSLMRISYAVFCLQKKNIQI